MTSSAPSSSRRMPVIIAALLLGVLLIVWLATRGSDDTTSPDPSATSTSTDGQPDGRIDSMLLDLAESGRDVSFHARYAATNDDVAEAIGFSSVELWRHEGWTRQDTTAEGPDGITRTQAVRSPDGVVNLCVLSADGVWGCTQQQNDDDNDLFLAAARRLARTQPTSREATIAGHDGACWSAASNPNAEVCYRTDGVPLGLTVGPDGGMDVILLEANVDDAVFTTPEDGTLATETPSP